MGIANGGVGYALDEHNASLVSSDMKAAVDAAASLIANGSMSVHNYTDAKPAQQFHLISLESNKKTALI